MNCNNANSTKIVLIYILLAVPFLNGYAQQIIKKTIPDKLVVLTFDDAPVSQFTVAAPLLKKYGFNATFFVCEFPPNYTDSTKYMTWRQIQQLGKMGFEVANHTRTHAPVSQLSKEQFKKELKYIEDKCDSLKIGKPETFAYPGYDLDAKALLTLQECGYAFARIGGDRAFNPLVDHPYLVPSWAMKTDNQETINNALQQAKDGMIVVLTIHGVPDYEHPWVTTSPEVLKKHLAYLSKNHYKVIALKDLSQYINVKKALAETKPLIIKNFMKH